MVTHGTTVAYWRGCRCEDCKDACRAYNQAYYRKHQKRIKAASRAYYAADPERGRERVLARNNANREAKRENDRAYYAANRERWKGYKQRRIALKKSHPYASYTTGARINARFAFHGHRCRWCGAGGELHADHAVPLARGGCHLPANIVPACARCNRAKSDSPLSEWLAKQPVEWSQW
jgi:5-methylcytosine-specific restriction endonuclease McrA